ncbi:MAG: DUF2779 domain-containing protein [Alphaproteobacteria bacterium]
MEINAPDLAEFDGTAQQNFSTGNRVGEIAKQIFGPGPDISPDNNLAEALAETAEIIESDYTGPIYEATFQAGGVLVRVDVLVKSPNGYDMIEVKASTKVKENVHLPDCTIQAWVLEQAGLTVRSVGLGHINNEFVYQTEKDYRGLLKVADVTKSVESLTREVPRWIGDATDALSFEEPNVAPSSHCRSPYDCPFLEHCAPFDPDKFPISILGSNTRIAKDLVSEGVEDVRDVESPHGFSKRQDAIWRATTSGEIWFEQNQIQQLKDLSYPRYYLDFETVAFAVPEWIGTRPYQPIPFQWSCHVENPTGEAVHLEYLHDGADLPARGTAEALIDAMGSEGPILMYTSYERRCIQILADLCPDLSDKLEALIPRLFDMHPIVRNGYYHKDMRGSSSIKKVLPTIPTTASYETVGDISHGGAAAAAYEELLDDALNPEDRKKIRDDLEAYCHLDTLAMLEVALHLTSQV